MNERALKSLRVAYLCRLPADDARLHAVAVIRDDKVYGYMRTDDLAVAVTVYQLAVR